MAKSLFLLHPRSSFKQDYGFLSPEKSEEELEEYFANSKSALFNTTDNKEKLILGWLGMIPLKGSQIISNNMAEQRMFKRRALDRIFKCIRMALDECKGEHLVVGLGALTAPITNQGKDIIKEFGDENLSVTTGNAYTAYITIKSIELLIRHRNINLAEEKIAILGASGSVGSAVSKYFGKKGYNLILSARNLNKLKRLKEEIEPTNSHEFESKIELSTDINDIKKAKIVIVTTSSNSLLIHPEHCAKDAIIYDDTQPKNTSEEIVGARPDVLVVDGGIVKTPYIVYENVKMDLPKECSYACLSETLFFAKDDFKENYTGTVTLEQVKKSASIADKYKDEFFIAPFSSFGKPLNLRIITTDHTENDTVEINKETRK